MVPLAMSAVGVKKEKINFASTLGNTSVFLTLAGLLIFIFFKTHSIVWIAPGLLYVYLLFSAGIVYGEVPACGKDLIILPA